MPGNDAQYAGVVQSIDARIASGEDTSKIVQGFRAQCVPYCHDPVLIASYSYAG